MRGRKPKPTALKTLHGNPGKRALPRLEPKPKGKLSEPPEWFSESQKAGWAYAISQAPFGLLRRIDRSALTVWVIAEDLHRQAVILQGADGMALIVKAPKSGQPIQSPYLAIINRQGLIMLKAASELGFSPASRPRTQVDADGAWPDDEHDGNGAAGSGEDSEGLAGFLANDPDAPRH